MKNIYFRFNLNEWFCVGFIFILTVSVRKEFSIVSLMRKTFVRFEELYKIETEDKQHCMKLKIPDEDCLIRDVTLLSLLKYNLFQ